MNRSVVKVFVVISICLSFKECDSVDVDLSEQTTSTVEVEKAPSIAITNTTSAELQNLVLNLNQLIQKINSGQQRSGADMMSKEIAGYPDLPPFIETLRAYFKMAYKSYLLFQPEIKFGQCIIKYFYMRFPNTMRIFRPPDLMKYIRRMYSVSGIMTNNIITRTIFSFFDDTEVDRERIAIKMATMTGMPLTPFQKAEKPILDFYEAIQSPQFYTNVMQLPVYSGPVQLQRRRRRRFQREAKNPSRNDQDHTDSRDEIQYKNNMKRAPRQSEQSKIPVPPEMDPDATIDLINKEIEHEAEELFAIDKMFWSSLGFEDDSFKKYSLAYCTREYFTGSFGRFMKNIVLA